MRVGDETVPWWRLLGPWPQRPLLVTIAIALYLAGVRNAQRIYEGSFELLWLTEGSAVAIGIAAVCGLVMYGGMRWQQKFGVRMWSYILIVLLTTVIFIAMRILIGDVDIALLSDPVTLLTAVLRLTLVMFLILIVSGWAGFKLSRQVERTQAALDLTRQQQAILLQGDEYTRRQISGSLHDRVQARLIASCLELQMVDVDHPEVARRTLASVVAQLEEIRSVDVRRVARALSPRLGEIDLESALEELAAQYTPGMSTTITVDDAIDDKSTRPAQPLLLGSYRIVEQALLNAAGHGAARQCEVDITVSEDEITVVVKDDGRGFSGEPNEAGFGSTLMTAWSESLNGHWSWRPGKSAGVVVTAAFPLEQSQS